MKTSTIRRQLTLLVSQHKETIELIRKEYNPIQFQLIPAHVTLCREDEIEELERLIQNIKSIRLISPLTIAFGDVERFESGKGVFIPARSENDEFQDLRCRILDGLHSSPRLHWPHITLMHPRNSTCTDEIFSRIQQLKLPAELSFDKISLIEQRNEGPWKLLDEFQIC